MANIVIDVAGQSAGTPGVAREFNYTFIDPSAPLVTLSLDDGTGVLSYEWSILSQPEGASAVLNTPTAATSTFTPTVGIPGTYLVQCVINGGVETIRNAVAWQTKYLGLRIPAAGELTEFGAKGWALAVRKVYEELDNRFGAGAPTSFTPGSVLFAGATGSIEQDNANFFFDDSLDMLGLGTALPSSHLDIEKTGNIKSNMNFLELTNTVNASDMDLTEHGISWKNYYYDAITPAEFDSGRLSIIVEDDATSTPSTINTSMAFYTTKNGVLGEQLRITSDGYLKDSYLTNGVGLSESGETSLDTTSQSLVGAINEVYAAVADENLWDLASTTLIPHTAGNLLAGGSSVSGTWSIESTTDSTKGVLSLQPTSGYVDIGAAVAGELLSLGGVDTTNGNPQHSILWYDGGGNPLARVRAYRGDSSADGDLVVSTMQAGSDTEVMRWTEEGYVGVNKTDPGYRFHSVEPDAGGTAGYFDQTYSGSSTTYGIWASAQASSARAGKFDAAYSGTGTNYGVYAQAKASTGRGGYFEATNTGVYVNYGVLAEANGKNGVGGKFSAPAFGNYTSYGIQAYTNSDNGVAGEFKANANGAVTNYGIDASADGDTGRAVYGHVSEATAYSGYFDGGLFYVSSGLIDSYLTAGIPLSQTGTTGLVGFTATSIVGALNEVRADVTSENTWDRTGTVLIPHTAGDTLAGGSSVSGTWAIQSTTDVTKGALSLQPSGGDVVFGTGFIYGVGDLTFKQTGTKSIIFDLSACTGTADGLFITNGTDNFNLIYKGSNLLDLEADLQAADIACSTTFSFSGTNASLSSYGIFASKGGGVYTSYINSALSMGLNAANYGWIQARDAAANLPLYLNYNGGNIRLGTTAIVDQTNGRFGVGTAAPVVSYHVQKNNISAAIGHLTTGAGILLEGTDSVVELASSETGTWGSVIGLTEIQSGALIDKWGFARKTTTGSGDGSFWITYGANADVFTNSAAMRLTTGLDMQLFGILYTGGGGVYTEFTNSSLSMGFYPSNYSWIQSRDAAANLPLYLNYNGGNIRLGTTAIVDQTNGRFGVGTATPSSYIDVEKAGTVTSLTNFLELTNTVNAASMAGTETSIEIGQYYYDASTPARVAAMQLTHNVIGNWTSTAGTQQGEEKLRTLEAGVLNDTRTTLSITLANGGTYDLPSGLSGFLIMQWGDGTGNAYVSFKKSGAVTDITSDNTEVGTHTGTTVAIYDAGSNVQIENRNGYPVSILLFYMCSQGVHTEV